MERTTMSVQELSAQMGISLPKAYELVKTPRFSYPANRYQNPDPYRCLQRMANETVCKKLIPTRYHTERRFSKCRN